MYPSTSLPCVLVSPLSRVNPQCLIWASPNGRRLRFSLTNAGRPSSVVSWLCPSSNSLCELASMDGMWLVVPLALCTSSPSPLHYYCCPTSCPPLSPLSYRAMNLFLRSYPKIWLENVQRNNHLALQKRLVVSHRLWGVGLGGVVCGGKLSILCN